MRYMKVASGLCCALTLTASACAYAQDQKSPAEPPAPIAEAPASAPAHSESLSREVLYASGLAYQIASLPATFQTGFNELQRESGEEYAPFFNALQTGVPAIYRPDDILRFVETGMDKGLTDDDKKQLLAHFNSPLGKRIAGLEREATGRETEIALYTTDTSAYAARIPLYTELNTLTGASELAANAAIDMGVAMETGIMSALSGVAVDATALNAEVERQRPAVLRQTAEAMVKRFAYTYRDLTDDELKSLMEFARSPSGSKFHRVVGGLLTETLTSRAKDLGKMLVSIVTATKPK